MLRVGSFGFVIASLFLISFGMITHSASAELMMAQAPSVTSASGIGASPDSDVVFLHEVGCLNSLIAKGEFAQMWHSCLRG